MDRRLAQHPDMDWEAALYSYSGYVNLVSGAKFQNLDLAGLPPHLEDILLYAMSKNKTHFVRLVDGDPEAFRILPVHSFLLQERLYREHLNPNELTAKDLACCGWMRRQNWTRKTLSPAGATPSRNCKRRMASRGPIWTFTTPCGLKARTTGCGCSGKCAGRTLLKGLPGTA